MMYFKGEQSGGWLILVALLMKKFGRYKTTPEENSAPQPSPKTTKEDPKKY